MCPLLVVYWLTDISGYLIVNPKKTIDIQHIALKFYGFVETYSGDKFTLLNEEKQLAKPLQARKYTTFFSGQIHEYDFEFEIPRDKRLPSSANIPKVANVVYFLTATLKKPRFRFSHSLCPISEEVKILDKIDVQSLDYISPVNMSSELGFINGSKLCFWNLYLPKSAFLRGTFSLTVEQCG
ncbi:hypothetical protein BDF20DRAFT_811126 [Mycotypha africana]|uniref:uncharacterized protein n=1 Tax=Mycotypha africana TaxID=64632 RepID=UPI002300CC43|nr:uncharacterized protein BDF20DRAFT_811126 [Mycotypha africana]KAI8990762.1 hypothetical protein BDF20DRAFT_811126 [Mycotypha africana]